MVLYPFLNMVKIEFIPGTFYHYQHHKVLFKCTLGLNSVLVEYQATGHTVSVPVWDLEPLSPEGVEHLEPVPLHDNFLNIPEKAWVKARGKLAILQPLLRERRDSQLLQKIADEHNLSKSTLYRWLQAYQQTGSVQSLVDLPKGGKDKKRLGATQEDIIQEFIEKEYLKTQKISISDVVSKIRQCCRQAGLLAPSDKTVRRRIEQISTETKIRRRWSKKMAKEKCEPLRGSFPGADFPLAVVQVDHTLVDLILVNEINREPLGRPYLTLAIDVFSRMVVGFYLSFDPPGAVGTGLCMIHSILPKELWLSRMDAQNDWPCWGIPSVIHVDNAKEFRGIMLQRACEKYGIRLEYRPVKTPNWGGHIERLMGTFMKEVHTLPGTTFSNVRDRKDYDSEKEAALTLPEFEQWLTIFIVDVYHKRIHQTLKKSPYERYQEGILGSPSQLGTGLQDRLYDEVQIRLDFMPFLERTIQPYGVLIDHIHYYADVLRPYINSFEEGSGKESIKRLFTFRRDPRDISRIYFLEPETSIYYAIPYRDTSHPAISIWEFRKAKELVRLKGIEAVDEDSIFAANDKRQMIALAAMEKTKRKRLSKSDNRLIQGVSVSIGGVLSQHDAANTKSVETSTHETPGDSIDDSLPKKARLTLTPFDELHDDSFAS
jgi:putative transposase